MTAAPASATTTRLLCSVEAAPEYSPPTALGLGLGLAVAATALLLGLIDVLVDTAVVDDLRMVEVAVAWMTVCVIVVVIISDVVGSCAKTEGTRMTVSAAMAAVKRILLRYMARCVEVDVCFQSQAREYVKAAGPDDIQLLQ